MAYSTRLESCWHAGGAAHWHAACLSQGELCHAGRLGQCKAVLTQFKHMLAAVEALPVPGWPNILAENDVGMQEGLPVGMRLVSVKEGFATLAGWGDAYTTVLTQFKHMLAAVEALPVPGWLNILAENDVGMQEGLPVGMRLVSVKEGFATLAGWGDTYTTVLTLFKHMLAAIKALQVPEWPKVLAENDVGMQEGLPVGMRLVSVKEGFATLAGWGDAYTTVLTQFKHMLAAVEALPVPGWLNILAENDVGMQEGLPVGMRLVSVKEGFATLAGWGDTYTTVLTLFKHMLAAIKALQVPEWPKVLAENDVGMQEGLPVGMRLVSVKEGFATLAGWGDAYTAVLTLFKYTLPVSEATAPPEDDTQVQSMLQMFH